MGGASVFMHRPHACVTQTLSTRVVDLFAVVFHELVYLKSRFFAIGCEKDLVVPLPVGISFPYYFSDFSAFRFLFNCILDGRRERFEIDLFAGILSMLS